MDTLHNILHLSWSVFIFTMEETSTSALFYVRSFYYSPQYILRKNIDYSLHGNIFNVNFILGNMNFYFLQAERTHYIAKDKQRPDPHHPNNSAGVPRRRHHQVARRDFQADDPEVRQQHCEERPRR